MATLKINYNGTIYSMVKTSSKITTPSVAVDGGWIPCFKGDRFGEVVNGDRIYTLSPLMVNGYRLACGRRNISIRVYGHFWLYGNYIGWVQLHHFVTNVCYKNFLLLIKMIIGYQALVLQHLAFIGMTQIKCLEEDPGMTLHIQVPFMFHIMAHKFYLCLIRYIFLYGLMV